MTTTTKPKRKRKRSLGKCYEQAAMSLYEMPNAFLVHGRPRLSVDARDADGNVVPKGTRFGHAWVEFDGYAYDPSTGRTFWRESYYRVGDIEEAKCRRYSLAEACEHMLRTKHYGPWDE